MTATRCPRWLAGLALGALAVASGAGAAPRTSGAEASPGSAGTDTSLPMTDSAVTVRGRGAFESLEITVNQTEDLGNQAISVTWSGGTPTQGGGGANFAAHFLQIMQCWSEPDAPGPLPEQCVFGATDGVYGGRNGALYPPGFVDERIVARGDFESFDPAEGELEATTNWQWKPFRSVTGAIVGPHIDTSFSPSVESGDFWLNPFFNVVTTNEIAGARTRPDGTGEELFEVTTGLESGGLGCGQAVLAVGDAKVTPRCWLVVVPRGSAAEENAGTISGSAFEDAPGVVTSPLRRAAWQHHIAVPLGFDPVGTQCDLDAEGRRIVGSELLLQAVTSWQPALCTQPGLPPYIYTTVPDGGARQQLVSGVPGAPGMAVTSRPLAPGSTGDENPVVYAPLALSALVVGFNVERVADVSLTDESVKLETSRLAGTRVAQLNLTPRLVAKLLTQSYERQVRVGNSTPPEGYEWAEGNPGHLDVDPDFLRFNPEFELLSIQSTKNFGGLVLAAGASDAARQVWEWVLADLEARAWLDGAPDEWGMVVNPAYATTAAANSTGLPFADPVPESFPKADPYCYQAPPQGLSGKVVPPALCGTDWLPYAESYRDASQRARAANDRARTTANLDAAAPEQAWKPNGPQPLGMRAILALVDAPTAAQYGLQVARLSRAGDDGDGRAFIAPDRAGLAAAVGAMAPSGDDPNVLVPDPRSQPDGAYPLATLAYAAVTPLSLDDQARTDYAALVDYAVDAGQVEGVAIGQLPPGYAPLPAPLAQQSLAAAEVIRSLEPIPPEDDDADPEPEPAVGAVVSAPGAASPTPVVANDALPEPSTPVLIDADTPAPESSSGDRATTPSSPLGSARFAIPAVGIVALLSTLGALEITKRPRRGPRNRPARPGVTALAWVAALALASSLVAAVRPAGAQPAAPPSDAGELAIVGADGRSLAGGGSATEFTLAPSGAAECPGDSANDNYRLYSFMVPIDVAAEAVTFNGLGPIPQVYEHYDDFRMPLFDVSTRDYAAGLTAMQDAPGGPGAIVDIPMLSFAVYREGEMPFGEYRVGLACTVLNEVKRFWDTSIVVTRDGRDRAGFSWRVTGAVSSNSSSGGGRTAAALLGAGALTVAFLAHRSRSRRSRSLLEVS